MANAIEVNYVETRQLNGPDGNDQLLIIVVDKETEIRVHGYGCALYTLDVSNIVADMNPGYDPAAILAGISEGYRTATFWGTALTWAEPLTIAHLVMDVINNQ